VYKLEIKTLEQILENHPCDYHGICESFRALTTQSIGGVIPWYNIVKKWPKFSGSITYPVPAFDSGATPASAFNSAIEMWEGGYGELRKELLRYTIDELKRLDDEERCRD